MTHVKITIFLGQADPKDLLDPPDLLDPEELQVVPVPQESQVFLDHKEQLVLLDLQDFKAQSVYLVSPDRQELLETVV